MGDEMCTGRVFSIERFSIHDGPGVRTSVFLKGCNLSCIWCHNPESGRREQELQFVEKDCVLCGHCGQVCERSVHQFCTDGSERTKHTILRENCDLCGSCVRNCPAEALHILGYEMGVAEAMEIIRRDKIYYKTDGGVTLSGGEPLLQAKFCRELLKQCREEKISTCVETAGDVPFERFRQVMDVTDVFLFDYKLSDEDSMRRFTGGNLGRILSNLRELRREGREVILRCPVIPGINDTEVHFRRIAALARKEKIGQVELMPYHNFGKDKWLQIGRDYKLKDLESVSREQENRWKETLRSYLEEMI